MAAARTQGDRFEHARFPDRTGGKARDQLDDLAARVVLEEVPVVFVLEKEGHGAGGGGFGPRVTDAGAGGKGGRRGLGAAVGRGGQGDERPGRGPLQHPGRIGALPARGGAEGGDHAGVAGGSDAAVGGRGDPHPRGVLEVREKGESRAVGGPHEIADVDAVGKIHIGEGALAERVEAEPVQAVEVEVPGAVGARPDLQHREAQGLLADLFQRGQLGRERDHEVVAVRAEVVEGCVVRVGGEEVLDGVGGEDVAGLGGDGVAGWLGAVLRGEPRREEGRNREQEQVREDAEAVRHDHSGSW